VSFAIENGKESAKKGGNGYIVKIICCKNLPAKNLDGFSDPYVKVKLAGHNKQKTKVQKKTLNPEYNNEFYYATWGKHEKLEVSVWDYTGRLAKKVFIGQVLFSYPEQAVITGTFPLMDQKDEQPVGGTIDLTITSDYIMPLLNNDIGNTNLSNSRGGVQDNNTNHMSNSTDHNTNSNHGNHHDHEAEKKDETSVSRNTLTPSSLEPTIFHTKNPESRRGSTATESSEQSDREKELKELKKKERIEKEEQEKKRWEEMMERLKDLESENKKKSLAIEILERELTDVRQTVTVLQAKSQKKKNYLKNLFSCCSSSSSSDPESIEFSDSISIIKHPMTGHLTAHPTNNPHTTSDRMPQDHTTNLIDENNENNNENYYNNTNINNHHTFDTDPITNDRIPQNSSALSITLE